MSKGCWKATLEGAKVNDLLVGGPPITRDGARYWPARCLRPVHGDEVVIRYCTTTQLRQETVKACMDCVQADLREERESAPYVETLPIAPPPRCLAICGRFGNMIAHAPQCPTMKLVGENPHWPAQLRSEIHRYV